MSGNGQTYRVLDERVRLDCVVFVDRVVDVDEAFAVLAELMFNHLSEDVFVHEVREARKKSITVLI